MNLEKNLLPIIIAFGVILGLMYFGGNWVVDKTCDRVIEKMQRDYTPGPYQPGFDPDKVNVDQFRQGPPQFQSNFQTPPELGTPEDWNRLWESQRR
ncbi:MAG: hypothetical protein DWQ19_10590 [Crenarchaeota archaeon]|nr:MAG: hypothetical protein DWQ19_10590 [Thermoproteota archaeon]